MIMVQSIFVVRSQQILYPAIYVISCDGQRNGKTNTVFSFSVIKLRFVINVLNKKTIILLNLAEFPLILAKYQATTHAISHDNC